ncbi:MAG: hypothetical protein ACTSWY_09685 [Promethearchaeota archaeon]
MSERTYSKMVEKGTTYFKRCLDAKTHKNRISLGKKALISFRRALSAAKELNIKRNIPLIFEYLTQINSIIAASNYELKELVKAIKYYRDALFVNKSAKKNSAQRERVAYINGEMAKIFSKNKQMEKAKLCAFQAFSAAKKLDDNDTLLDLYIDLNPIFIKSLDIKRINSNYLNMIKLARRTKRKKTKAQVYFDFARYLFVIKKDYSGSKEYLQKAKTLFEILHLEDSARIVEVYYNSKFNKNNDPILEMDDKK